MSNISQNSGKRLTFSQLIKEFHIQIPIIQRDYAQGRHSAEDIRTLFLDALYIYLIENEPNRDLDFVYGNQYKEVEDDLRKFIPLDGQQRLTTLFLLHWYLATKKDDHLDDFRELLVYYSDTKERKSKFTYETRTSSREFCDALVINNVDLNELNQADNGKNNRLSKTIRDSSWFYMSWDADPTIQSMLVMLDAIHQKFNTKEAHGFFKRLIDNQNPVITFQFLDLKEFKLTDDLYIKMNSRGVPLTPFENFKANFESFIKISDFNNKSEYSLEFCGETRQVDTQTYFSHKLDTDWANLFWAYTTEDRSIFDKLIMNFIWSMAINHYAGRRKGKNLKELLNKKSEGISYLYYDSINCFDEKYVTDVITVLDLLKNGNYTVKSFSSDFYYNDIQSFKAIVNNDFKTAAYLERIMFHAFCQYLIKWKDGANFIDNSGLGTWMRVIHNLAENTAPYNNEAEFIRSISSINELIDHSNNILEYLINNQKIEGFDPEQIIEERLKAILIKKNNGWDTLLYRIERHGYFKGQIGFVLFLAGIKDYYQVNSHCNWNEEEDSQFKKSFNKNSNKALALFDDSGLIRHGNYLWERALLATGHYLITEGANQSFLINNDRDISWKRLLKADKDKQLHPQIIRDIFNAFDKNKIEKSLTKQIESYQDHDWREKFISIPKLLDFLTGKRYIRIDSKHGFVLFQGERMSGAHAELYSYAFYIQYLKDKNIEPFTESKYYYALGDNELDTPCAYLDNWPGTHFAINIGFLKDTRNFEIRFYDKANNMIIESVNIKLKKQGMALSDPDSQSFVILHKTEKETLSFLKNICEALTE